MKKSFVIVLSIFFVTNLLYSSEPNFSFTFGRPSQYEFSLTEYENDPNAEALVIYEFGDYNFVGDYTYGSFMLNKNLKIKIKILNEAGIRYANFEVPIYTGDNVWEKFLLNSAITYNAEDGQLKKTELDKKKIFDEKINDRWLVKKFTMPDVRVGSIVELDYSITTPYFFNMGRWEFQKKIPVVYSKLRYKAIPYYIYSYIAIGIQKFDEFSSDAVSFEQTFGNAKYKELEYIFGMKDIPAFKDEEFITSPKDYMQALNFQLSTIYYLRGGEKQIMSTWPQMCDEFIKSPEFGKYINASEKQAKKILPELQLSGLAQEEQLKKITLYVKSMYSWDGHYGKYAVESLSDFQKKKTGNTANLNLYLIGFLKAAGLDVAPVILSTRNNGAISKLHPFESFFNYVIAMVTIDGEKHYIDASESLLYYNELPARCVNVEGLVIKPKTEEWATIYQQEPSLLEKNFNITIDSNERKLDIEATYIASGNEAYRYRSRYMNKEKNLAEYLKERNNIDVSGGIEIKNMDELNKPFSFSFEFENGLERTADKLFVNPFCGLALSQNPFKQNKRTSPVDLMFLIGEKYASTIEIPQDYQLEFIPKGAKIKNGFLSFNYTVKTENNTIRIEAEYFLNKAIYRVEEYETLKNMMSVIVDKLSEKIIFVKGEK